MRHAMIMAGGAGTRLWPLSREGQPKQLIEFIPDEVTGRPRSLLEISALRLKGVVPDEHQLICTGERYREQIEAALPAFAGDRLLGEPVARDTLNAVGFTAAVLSKRDGDAVFAVVTADQLIEPVEVFAKRLELGFALVEQDPTRLVTFAIKPTYPATGYGYVERGSPIGGVEGCVEDGEQLVHRVANFVEKPPLHKAQAYVESGMFGWNAGMFVFNASTFMSLLERHQPEAFAGLATIRDAWGTDEQDAVLNEIYPTLPKTSVDYGIMEPASSDPAVTIAAVEMGVRWLDVGSWPSFFETLEGGETGHKQAGPGAAAFHDGERSAVYNDDPTHTVALLGCEDLIVVHTKRATLVMPASRAEDLKQLRDRLPDDLR
ncbi:MAG: mannose-1-phosphate guanylyltransferase [Planctomycetota bacterium]